MNSRYHAEWLSQIYHDILRSQGREFLLTPALPILLYVHSKKRAIDARELRSIFFNNTKQFDEVIEILIDRKMIYFDDSRKDISLVCLSPFGRAFLRRLLAGVPCDVPINSTQN